MNQIYTGGILEITYLVASILFILGLKMLSHPETARKGNILAAIGMVLAIIATIVFHKKDGEPIQNIGLIIAAIAMTVSITITIASFFGSGNSSSATGIFIALGFI